MAQSDIAKAEYLASTAEWSFAPALLEKLPNDPPTETTPPTDNTVHETEAKAEKSTGVAFTTPSWSDLMDEEDEE
jgi:hypothetical protein